MSKANTPARRRSISLLSFAVASFAVAQPAPEATDPGAPTTAATEEQTFEAMGYALAAQIRLNVGFSDEELEAIFAGMRLFAHDAEPPAGFDEAIQAAQEIYFARFQAFNAAEQERIQQQAAADQEARQEQAAKNRAAGEEFLADLQNASNVRTSATGLLYEIIEEGREQHPQFGETVRVNYRGSRIDGTEFDAGEGVTFRLQEVGGLIDGFKEGLQLIGEGGSIKLYIPADLAYGDNAPPGAAIQPGDTLIFEIDLLEISRAPTRQPSSPPDYRPSTPPPASPPPGPPPARVPDAAPPAPGGN